MWCGGSVFSIRFRKKITSVLSGSTFSPALVSQSAQAEYPQRMVASMSSQLRPHAKMAPSSMYMPRDALAHSLIL